MEGERVAILSLNDSVNIDLINLFPHSTKLKIINNMSPSEIVNNKLADKYDYVLAVKGNEKISNVSSSIRYYKGMDSVGGDLEQTNNNPLDIIKKMIQREDYLAVNTLGYVKNKLSKIEKNYYLRDGGIWVKSGEKSSLYITLECLSVLNIQDLESFNVLV